MRNVIAALAIIALPSASFAQVTTVSSRTGAVMAQTGDHTVSQISGAGAAATQNIGTSGANVPLLSGTNTWAGASLTGTAGQQLFDLNHNGAGSSPTTNYVIIADRNGDGIVSPRTQTMLQIVGAPNPAVSPEVNVIDAFGYNGYPSIDLERYDRGGPNNGAVQSGEGVGTVTFDPYDGVSDAATAVIAGNATETQVHGSNHGTDLVAYYTPNAAGATIRVQGWALSPGGLGGMTVGSPSGGASGDLGAGTLNVQDSIATGNHFRSIGSRGSISSCGTSPVFNRGNDQAGEITVGSAVTACTYTFAHSFGGSPICLAQTFGAAAPVTYISDQRATYITVMFSAPFTGSFQFICMGIS